MERMREPITINHMTLKNRLVMRCIQARAVWKLVKSHIPASKPM